MSALNPAWFTESVVSLARVCRGVPNPVPPLARVEPQADKLTILADALEEAGCDDATLLRALRTGEAEYARQYTWANPVRDLAESTPESNADAWEKHVKCREVAAARKAKEYRETKYADARRGIAVSLGKAWHARVADLYQSKRAGVVYGRGGEEVVDWDAYGKKGYTNPHTGRKQPAKYRNAGARVVGFARSGRVVLENSRGSEVARLPLPPAGAVFEHSALVGGDLFCTVRTIAGVKVAARFAPRKAGGKGSTGYVYVASGFALRLGVPAALRGHSPFPAGSEHYWEHGSTAAACRREYRAKLALAEANRAAADARDLADAERKLESYRLERKARLLLAVGTRLTVGYDDARACGMCDAGIMGFAGRLGLTDKSATVPLRVVAAKEPGRAMDLAKHLIRKREANGGR